MYHRAPKCVVTLSNIACAVCVAFVLYVAQIASHAAASADVTSQSEACDLFYRTVEGTVVGIKTADSIFLLCGNEKGVLHLRLDVTTGNVESIQVNSRSLPPALRMDGRNRPDAKEFYYPFDEGNLIRDAINREGQFVCFPEFDRFGSDLPKRARVLASCLKGN